jgi:hypothetical protein
MEKLATTECTTLANMLFSGNRDDIELAVDILANSDYKIKNKKWSKIKAGLRKARDVYPPHSQERYEIRLKIQHAFDQINKNRQADGQRK